MLDALRYAALQPVTGFGAVIFRRTSPQITATGGLWDEASKIYPLAGGKPNQTRLEWKWPQHRTTIRFSHMQYESDMYDWQGSQIAYIGFDEATHFTESQVFYMLSRNRSLCGVKPRMRLTTNPDADSWIKLFLAPWVDEAYQRDRGWRAQPGQVLRFYRDNDTTFWLHPGEDLPDGIGEDRIKTATYIPAYLSDNPSLTQANPDYYANIMALPLLERERLLGGALAWTIRPSGNMFKRDWFRVIDASAVPWHDLTRIVRRWDLAASEPRRGYSDPDYTCGVKMARSSAGVYYVLDAVFLRDTPAKVEQALVNTAAQDGEEVSIRLPQDPGQAGKAQSQRFVTLLDGYDVQATPETGDKETRAKPFSAQCEVGNVKIVRGAWNDLYLNQLTAFPMTSAHDDAVDASSGAHADLSRGNGVVVFAATHIASGGSGGALQPNLPNTAPTPPAQSDETYSVFQPDDVNTATSAAAAHQAGLARTLRGLLDSGVLRDPLGGTGRGW